MKISHQSINFKHDFSTRVFSSFEFSLLKKIKYRRKNVYDDENLIFEIFNRMATLFFSYILDVMNNLQIFSFLDNFFMGGESFDQIFNGSKLIWSGTRRLMNQYNMMCV